MIKIHTRFILLTTHCYFYYVNCYKPKHIIASYKHTVCDDTETLEKDRFILFAIENIFQEDNPVLNKYF